MLQTWYECLIAVVIAYVPIVLTSSLVACFILVQVREKGVLIDIEALGLEDKVNDVVFLNDIQGGVNKWIKEIQKVTRLIR